MVDVGAGNSLDTDGRGPSNTQLLGAGVGVLLLVTVITASLLLKATGRLDAYVRVVADLINVGDGLPSQSDVKYHGLLVGSVSDVVPATHGQPNFVHIDLKPQYAKDIPHTVTARVVPSNVFAVSSVQLVDPDGPTDAPAISANAHIPEDTELSTVIFQTTISKLRDVLAATGRGRDDHTLGILAAVGAATDHRRVKLLHAGAHLNRILDELNATVATEPGPSTITALLNATEGLKATAPDLVDTLHQAVRPMQTFVEKRAAFTSFISGSQYTFGTTREAFDNHTDQLVDITQGLTPPIGVFAMNAHQFVPIFQRLNTLSQKFFDEVWLPEADVGNMRANLSVTPFFTYTRADCPRYGEMKGPSCFTAPEIPVRPELPEVLLPQNYQPPAGLEPPPGTEIGPDGNLIAVGPPYTDPIPKNLDDPMWNPPLPWWTGPSPRVPGTADPDAAGPPPPPSPPIPTAPVGPPLPGSPPIPGLPPPGAPPPGPAAAAPAAWGGNVGPVGSEHERTQLGALVGDTAPATVATQLLLGPVARGNAVAAVNSESGKARK
ncbi:MlaD family protein [Mycolicibacillus parakoreensis]|uniref:MlaD family protein n=1 Tax=Mycolicibacillus parakoreensis TaxID=1069221 RepID=A0ABY3U5L2_9MYCO|nr:MCE family protein [Mycolicibacillus parakoreensis]ULN52689.1 MlaD family protein [Mycolicibacillus parakoreensis]